jgi:hypothetical protein
MLAAYVLRAHGRRKQTQKMTLLNNRISSVSLCCFQVRIRYDHFEPCALGAENMVVQTCHKVRTLRGILHNNKRLFHYVVENRVHGTSALDPKPY